MWPFYIKIMHAIENSSLTQVHFYSWLHAGKKKNQHMVQEEFGAPTKCFHLTYILYKSYFNTILIFNISFKICLHLSWWNQTKDFFWFFTAKEFLFTNKYTLYQWNFLCEFVLAFQHLKHRCGIRKSETHKSKN